MVTNTQSIEVSTPGPLAHLASGNHENLLQPATSMNPILQSTSTINCNPDEQIKLSKRRWLVLIAFSVFGLTIALTDITSPILVLFLELIGLDIHKYLYLQPMFFYFMLLFAFPTVLVVEKYGIKRAMHLSALLFVIHGFMRAIIFYPDFPHHEKLKFPLYIVSSIIGVEMMTIFFLLPLKVSETWFSSSERTVVWSLMVSQLNVGVCIASFLYPRIVKTLEDFKILAYVNVVCVLVTALTTLIMITKSEPKYPANQRIAEARKKTPASVKKSVIKMIKHKDIVVHLVHLSIFESLDLCIGSVLQPILLSIGYDKIFTGNLMSMNSLITIFMQVILAFFVHKLRDPTLTCKLGSFIQGMLFVIFALTIIVPQSTWILIATSVLLNLCKSWATPNFTNMTAQLACGTASYATVVGFSMFITVLIMTAINLAFTKLILPIPGKSTQNYENSLTFLCILAIINEVFYLICFFGQPSKKNDDYNDDGEDDQENNRMGSERPGQ